MNNLTISNINEKKVINKKLNGIKNFILIFFLIGKYNPLNKGYIEKEETKNILVICGMNIPSILS